MMRIFRLMIVCILVAGCAGDGKLSGQAAGKGDSGTGVSGVYSKAELLADFRQLGRMLETRHPRPYTPDAVVKQLLLDTETGIREGMTEIEFNRLLSPVVAAMKCGHTSLSVSRESETRMRSSARYLPFEVWLEEGRLLVTRNLSGEGAIPLLSEITKIDGMPVSRIVERLLEVTSADGENLSKKVWVIRQWFPSLYRLQFGERDWHEIEFLQDGRPPQAGQTPQAGRPLKDGQMTGTVRIPSKRLPEFDVTMHTLHLPQPGSGPRYSGKILHAAQGMARENHPDTVPFSPENNAATDKGPVGSAHSSGAGMAGSPGTAAAGSHPVGILRIASFSPGNLKEFRAFLASFFRELEYSGVDTLVIDLRGNFGGDARAAIALLGHLSGERFPYFDAGLPFYFYAILGREVKPAAPGFRGRVVALVDGACFSTTGHFLSFLKDRRMGILIGEETGGSRVVTDGSFDATLRNTGLRLHCASRIIATVAPSLPAGRGIGPDIEVVTKARDRVEGRDPVMDRALEMAGVFAAGHM